MSKRCPQSKIAKTIPFLAGVCDLGHTAGKTGTVSHGLILKGGHNITLREKRHHRECATVRINARDQSVQTQNLFDITLSGNTSGVLALISSGTMTLAGGNNITLSQAGNAATISGANQSFLAGLSTLGNTLGTTGTVSRQLIFAGGNNVTLSESINGQSATITISAAAVGAGSFSAGISTGGNTSGTSGTVENQLVFAGGNNITLSQSINGQSATITVSAFNQSEQTQNIIRDVNIIGNTSGTTADITSGTLYLAGGDNINLLQDGNSITISMAENTFTNFSAGVSNLGNTSGTTGTVNCRLVLVGTGEISLRQSVDGCSATVSISAEHEIDAISLSGNTSGTLSLISTGTAYLAGGNNITLSQDQDTITISAFNQSQQTQNIIRDVNIGGNTSGTTADITSGTLVLAGGENITLSQNANTLTIFAHHAFSGGMSNLGNTSGTSGLAHQELAFVGGNNITLIQSADINNESATITISGETIHEPMSLGISNLGNTSGTSTVSDFHRFVFVGGNNITLSQSNDASSGTLTISAFTQTEQTQNRFDLTLAGNTTGTLAPVSSGTLTLAGGNNITLSQAGNAITISAFSNTVSQYSAGISTGGNTSGTSGLAGRQLVLVGGNNITLSQSLNDGSATVTISAFTQTQQTQNIIRDVNIAGNTFGTTADITSGTMTLAGGNNITLSQNGNAITISAAAVGAGSFSAGISTGGNTSGTSGTVANQLIFAGGDNITVSQSVNGQSATITISAAAVGAGSFSAGISTGGNTSGTSGTVANQLIFAGGNNITLSQSINGQSATITISASNQSQQTQNIIRDVNIIGNTSGTTADITSGTLFLAGGNAVTLSQDNNSITISAMEFTAGVSNLGNTSGTTGTFDDRLILVGGNNITLIQSIDPTNESGTITISAFNQTEQTQNRFDLTLAGNTTGTLALVSSGTLTLAGGNNITLSQAGNAITISAFSNTVSQYSAGVSTGGNTSGTTVAGLATQQLVLAGGNNITLSQSTNNGSATVTISAPNQSTQTQNLFDLTLAGNTSGTLALVSSGTLTLVGGNNITLNQAGNAITVSGGNSYSAGMSNLGNTSGTSNLVSQQLILVGGNNVTLSQSTNGGSATLTISGGNSYSAGVSTGGNTTGTTGLVSQRLVLVGGNNITLSQSTNGGSATVTISALSDPTLSYWGYGDQDLDVIATSNGTFFLFPLVPFTQMLFPGNMTVSTALLDYSCTDSNASQSFTHSWKIGIYTINDATLSLLNSVAATWGSNQSSVNTSLFSGRRFLTIHSSEWSASPTFSRTMYYVGIVGNTSGNSVNFSMHGYNNDILRNGIRSGTIGVGNTTGNTSMGWVPWVGISVSSRNITAGLPTNIQLSQLVKTGALYGFIPHIQFNNISSNF